MTHNSTVAKLLEDSAVFPCEGKTLFALCEKYLTLGGFKAETKFLALSAPLFAYFARPAV